MSKLLPIEEPELGTPPSEKKVIAILKDGSKVTVVRPDWVRAMTAAAKHNPVEVHHISAVDSEKTMVWKHKDGDFTFARMDPRPKNSKLKKV